MADRMNIKFTIQAVDRFSATMTKLERKLESLKRKADDLDLGRDFDVNVDTTSAMQSVQALRDRLDDLNGPGNGGHDIDVNVGSGEALAELRRISRATEQMNSARIRVEVEADVARANLARIQQQVTQTNGRNVVIDILLRNYGQFRTRMDRIATTGRNVGEILTNSFMGLATTFSTTLVPIIASTTGMIGSLGVMIGTMAGATMGLASAFVATGFAAGGFAAFAVPAIKDLFAHMEDLNKQQEIYAKHMRNGDTEKAAKAMKEYERILASMSEEQVQAMKATKALREDYDALAESLEPSILRSYTLGAAALGQTMKLAEPMIVATADAVQRLMEKLNQNLQSDDMIAFFDYLNTYGASSLQTIMQGLGNFTVGIFNLMAAFAPLSVSMSGGFLEMSESFRQWSAALGDNAKFQAFVDYVRSNWPAVRRIIGTAIAAIIETFAGFSAYAVTWMATTQDLIDKWRAFAQGMGENAKFQAFIDYITVNGPKVTALIGDMVEFLVALGVALAPVGAKMVEVASAIFNFMTRVLEANPELSEMLGWFLAVAGGGFTLLPIFVALSSAISTVVGIAKLFGPTFSRIVATVTRLVPGVARLRSAFTTVRIALMLMGGPIMWIIGILLLLVPVFVRLWQTSETFRNTIITVFNAVREKVMEAVGAVVAFVQSKWATLVAYWEQNGEMIKQATSNVWNVIKTVISGAMTVIGAIFQAVWPVLQWLIVSVWGNIKGVISGALDFIMGLVTVFSALFTGNWSAMWEGVKQMFSGAVTFLWNAVQLLLWGKLLKGLAAFVGLFRTGVVALWNGIKALFTAGVTKVRTAFTTGFNAIKSFLDNIWTHIYVRADDAMIAMRTKITNGLNRIKQFFIDAWTTIYVKVSDALIRLRTAISDAWTYIYVKVSDAVIRVRTAVANAWDAIKTKVTTIITNVTTTIRNKFNAILTTVRTKMTAAKTALSNAWDAIKRKVSTIIANVLSTIRTKFTAIVTAVRTKMRDAKTQVTEAWNAVMTFLRGIDLAQIGKDIISGLIGGIKSMAGGLVDAAKGVVGGAIEGAKKLLKIKSPSRVFRSIGQFTMMGMQVGIESEAQRTIRAVTDVAKRMTTAFAPELEAAMNVTGGYSSNAYSGAGTTFAQARAEQAKARAAESRTVVEVPVYLNGKEIAKASNAEQNRMNAREQARKQQFSRTGGAQ